MYNLHTIASTFQPLHYQCSSYKLAKIHFGHFVLLKSHLCGGGELHEGGGGGGGGCGEGFMAMVNMPGGEVDGIEKGMV